MLERLNLDSLKGLDMSQVKSMGDTALKGIKGINMSQVKSMGDTALKSIKGINMSQVRTMGDTALKGISQLSKKRMKVAGYSVKPLLLGGAAALALGGYLILRNRGGNAATADLRMQGQVHPVK
jgi:hypothetical protein